MSADNWAICPQCLAQARELVIHEIDPEKFRTFREDWEIGIGEGQFANKFFMNYRGRCLVCELFFERTIEESVL